MPRTKTQVFRQFWDECFPEMLSKPTVSSETSLKKSKKLCAIFKFSSGLRETRLGSEKSCLAYAKRQFLPWATCGGLGQLWEALAELWGALGASGGAGGALEELWKILYIDKLPINRTAAVMLNIPLFIWHIYMLYIYTDTHTHTHT